VYALDVLGESADRCQDLSEVAVLRLPVEEVVPELELVNVHHVIVPTYQVVVRHIVVPTLTCMTRKLGYDIFESVGHVLGLAVGENVALVGAVTRSAPAHPADYGSILGADASSTVRMLARRLVRNVCNGRRSLIGRSMHVHLRVHAVKNVGGPAQAIVFGYFLQILL